MASRSQKTRFVKVILQGQIRGQRTGNGPEEKVTDRFAIFLLQKTATKMASRSQKTRFVKVILQGQIRAQRTGNGLEVKVTDRFAIFLLQKIAYQNG